MQVVTHRERGVIPGCVPQYDSFQQLDERAYRRSVERFCEEIQDYIARMKEIRAGV